MANETPRAALGYLNHLFVAGTAWGLPDDQLLDRSLAARDGAAFETLMARHGPMVLRVCRRLALPKQRRGCVPGDFPGPGQAGPHSPGPRQPRGMAYLVAYRVSIQANAAAARRRVQERRASEMSAMTSSHDPSIPDQLLPALHEEIARLPEKIRLAVVLYDQQGIP
jgi:HlyD family secretion protein